MAWLVLCCGGLFEIAWAIGLKYSDGFSRLVPSVLTLLAMLISIALLSYAAKTLPIGTAYAVWTGIGALGTALLGMWLLGEAHDSARLTCIALIVAGIVGLKYLSPS
ncbi:MAG: quaternary ammonium compound efflux SMR transporter SugE [Pseudomonadota bacterium]